MWRHILPNVLGPVIVSATLGVGGAILAESTLSFLGMGIQLPTPTWGNMLRASQSQMTTAPWIAFAPGAFIEHEPAFVIAPALVVEDQFADGSGKLSALPLAFAATGRVALAGWRRRAHSPDRVGRCAQPVGGHMRHCPRLAGGVCCFPRWADQVSGRRIGVAGGSAGWRHPDLAPRPGARQFDRAPRTIVTRSRLLEIVQHMLRAIRGPHGEKVVIGIREGAAATDRDEPRVGNVAEDHCFRTRTPWLHRGLRSGLTWRSIRAGHDRWRSIRAGHDRLGR
jgi:hypothetical protein